MRAAFVFALSALLVWIVVFSWLSVFYGIPSSLIEIIYTLLIPFAIYASLCFQEIHVPTVNEVRRRDKLPSNANYLVLFAHGNGSSPEAGALFSSTGTTRVADLENEQPGSSTWWELLDSLDVGLQPHLPLFDGPVIGVRTAQNWTDWNCGGEKDAALYAKAVEELIDSIEKEQKDRDEKMKIHALMRIMVSRRIWQQKIVLFGVSRGASTVYNALTILSTKDKEKWEKVIRPRLACVILFGAFESVEKVIKYRFPEPIQPLVRSVISRFSKYNTDWDPMMRSKMFPADLPVLFVASAKDQVVSDISTAHLVSLTEQAVGKDGIKFVSLLDVGHDFNFAQGDDLRKLHLAVHDILKKTLGKDV